MASIGAERLFLQALDARDVDEVCGLFAADGALVSGTETYQGRVGIRSYYERRFADVGSAHHVMSEIDRSLADNAIVSRWTWLAVLGPAATPLLSCGRYEFEVGADGKIIRLRVQVDATYGLGPATDLVQPPAPGALS